MKPPLGSAGCTRTRSFNIAQYSPARREWIKRAGTGVVAGLLGACSFGQAWRNGTTNYPRALSAQPFARPEIDAEQIIRTRVGLRPFRPGGFVVRAERLGEKVLIHNYGHGGAGITLSWGSSTLAVRELPDIADHRAAVLGCGVMGLSTARLLQARGWQVTIYAKDLPPNTTSDIAGGSFAPTSVYASGEASSAFATQMDETLRLSHAAFSKLVGPAYGVNWRENYYLSRRPTRAEDYYYLERWPELFPDIAELAPDEHPFPVPYVLRHLSLLIEPAIYLPQLMHEVRDAGGNIVEREMRNVLDVQALNEPVIFNCTGLGARNLFDDDELIPVRGQLVFMQPDERVDYITHGGGSGLLYMFPRADGILLGGTFERGETHLEPDADTTARIVHEHARMFGAMRI